MGRATARTSSSSAARPTPTTCTAWSPRAGILTSRGGKTSHAAVVARGMGRTCVCGADELDVDVEAGGSPPPTASVISEGDVISIDGTTGEVFAGEVPVVDSLGGAPLRGRRGARRRRARRRGRPADGPRRRRRAARACAPTRTPRRTPRGRAGSARRGSGCAAPSTCSSATGASSSSDLILAETTEEQRARRWPRCCRCSATTSCGILEAMDGLPVTIRLLDPPLHEFLPDFTELSVQVALEDERGTRTAARRTSCSPR